MKKITINIPDGADEKIIRIFSAQQQIAVLYPHGKKYVLKNQCVKCGKCCEDCEYLNKENECELVYTGRRPFRCSCDNPRGVEGCSVKYEEVE